MVFFPINFQGHIQGAWYDVVPACEPLPVAEYYSYGVDSVRHEFPSDRLVEGTCYHAVQLAEVGEVSKVGELGVGSASANSTSASR